MLPSASESTSMAAQSAPQHGAVMAFDFGKRRIGVAIGELELGIAHPLVTIQIRPGGDRFASIEALVAEWRPVLFIVGLPINADGTEHKLTSAVRHFGDTLTRKFGISSRLVDERYTSAEASSILRETGVRGRKQKAYLDQVAAQTILGDFFAYGS
jgi:putative Holliday junction resolvase